jgi:hypothetical protein
MALSRFAIVVLALSVNVGAQAEGQRGAIAGRGSRASGSNLPASVVALASWVTFANDLGADPGLIVIWRGSPRWFMKGGQRSSGGGSRTGYQASLTHGDVELSFALTAQPRSLKIQDETVEIGNHTVVLVDDVDGPGGPRVVKTLAVDLTGMGHRLELAQLGRLLSQSRDAVDFLRCDLQSERPGSAAVLGQVCRAAGRD